MKQLLLLVFFLPCIALSQKKDYQRTNNTNQIIVDANLKAGKSLLIPRFSDNGLNAAPDSAGYVRFNTSTSKFQGYYGTAQGWKDIGGGTNITVGPVVTSLPIIGDTTSTLQGLVNKFYQEPAPNVDISPASTVLELTSATTDNVTFTYSYSKKTGNTDFASATINGSATGVTQNVNGASGSYPTTVPTNTNSNFSILVTTVGGKSNADVSTVSYSPRRYWGRSSTAIPSQASILAVAGGATALNASKAGTFTITGSGSNYAFFAYPSSLGDITSLSIGGAPYNWNKTVISLTNARGYTQNYNVYTSTDPTNGNLTIVTQ